jgi:tripartite-type tricarboxylate transporter receptor subunit TctC
MNTNEGKSMTAGPPRLVALFVLCLAPLIAAAQSYPSGPVRLVIGYPPGGSAGVSARVLADELTRDLGVGVIVDNRPGAAATIASDIVARAQPDGRTLLVNWHQAVAKALLKKLPYDPERDFIPISRFASAATILVVHPSLPVRSLKEFIAFAKARPNQLAAALGGLGASSHLSTLQFAKAAGLQFNMVHYKGGGPASVSLLSGETQVMFSSVPALMPLIKAGKARPLFVSLRDGTPLAPGIPGSAAAGLPDFEFYFWFGLFAPAGTPSAIVGRLFQSVKTAAASPDVRAKLARLGMDATPSASPAAFAADLATEGPRLESLLKDIDARVE